MLQADLELFTFADVDSLLHGFEELLGIDSVRVVSRVIQLYLVHRDSRVLMIVDDLMDHLGFLSLQAEQLRLVFRVEHSQRH